MRLLMSAGLDTSAERPTRPTNGSDLTDGQLRELYRAPETPWLRVNFVSTVDGAATGSDGRSGSINNDADGRVFHLLRKLCDVVIVGAGTARAEGYKPGDKPIVVVSLSAEVPETLQSGEPGQVLMATVSTSPGLADAQLLLGEENVLQLGAERVDLAGLKASLVERGFHDMLCEGGPHLFDGLLAAGVADELCASVVPQLVGGTHTRITAGLTLDVPLELATLLEEDGTLLARWFIDLP